MAFSTLESFFCVYRIIVLILYTHDLGLNSTLISDTHSVNLRPLSPQSHDLKKIMKKPRPVKGVDESRSLSPPFKKKKKTQPVHDHGACSTPNYMKSTSSFEARKKQSPKTTTPKVARKLKKGDLASGKKGSRMSSLKTQPVHEDGARSTPNYMKSTSSFEARKEQSPKTATPKVARKLKRDDLASGKKGSRMSSLITQAVHDDGACSTPNYMKSTSSFEARKEQSPKNKTPKVARKQKRDDLASGKEGSRMSSLKTEPVHDDGARSTPNYMKSTSSFEARKEQSPKTTTPKVARKLKRDDLASGKKGSRMSSLKTQTVHDDGARSTRNYMKSTSSFEAKKEQSPKTTTPKVARKLKRDDLASGNKGSRISSLRKVRTLAKATSFKPSTPLKKVILGENLEAQRATCSSTLKESKFPDYLQLDHGGTESEGASAMKVCPYTYCSLNGHHHAPLPPLKCLLSAMRRALKTQKSFKVGCLSPRQRTPIVKEDEVKEPVIVATDAPQNVDMEEENRDFFLEIYSKDRQENGNQDLECLDIDWEEGYCSALFSDDADNFCKEKKQKTGDDRLYSKLQQLYDGETVTSGAWSEEDGDSESDGSYYKDHNFQNYDESEVSSTTTESNENDKMDEIQGLDLLIGEKNIDEIHGLDLQGFTRGKKSNQEMDDDLKEFNPRGPNFLPEVPDPDAETVDLKHQTMEERKNAEEWMVDFALHQAVTTLAPARKKRVSLVVEAFEKVLPIPKYETQKRPTQNLSQIQDRCKLAAERVLNKVENLHLQSSVQSLQSSAEN